MPERALSDRPQRVAARREKIAVLPFLHSALLLVSAPLPVGDSPAPVPLPHFPDRVHAFIWRNYELVPLERMAQVLGTTPDRVLETAHAMGLPDPPAVTEEQQRRSYITIIRRNWHLLPYEQLVELLGWTEDELAYTLREDDFLWVKLGFKKPACERLTWTEPDAATREREATVRAVVKDDFPLGLRAEGDPLFGFVEALSAEVPGRPKAAPSKSVYQPRYCYSYFALYGDTLLDTSIDSYPDGYLEKLAEIGVDGVWLQAVLYRMAPYPWDPSMSEHWETRLTNLAALVRRAKRHGIGVYLYLNEPRAMPLAFFDQHPDLKGVVEGDHAALCTSAEPVRNWLRDSVETIARRVPDLAGFFTISGSENLTSCWSHYQGAQCPRCAGRGPAEVIAEVNATIAEGARRGSPTTRLIAWDWGWQDDWAPGVIERLPKDVSLMSVSEWSIPFERGGISSEVGEYSISVVGPGPRAKRHWGLAKEQGLKTLAKLQISNTWEMSATPYVPALELVARHLCNLRDPERTGGKPVDGLQLGWTLGGYPSPNLELASVIGSLEDPTPEKALRIVAERRHGPEHAARVIAAWERMSTAFEQFPYHPGLLYQAPMQFGPSNPLYGKPTGYPSTMVGMPYDDLTGWRAIYPPDVYIRQFELMADGFAEGAEMLRAEWKSADDGYRAGLRGEADIAETIALHFRSCADQARFVLARDALAKATTRAEADPLADEIRGILRRETATARAQYSIQRRDSRIGYEASNHYYYVPLDLAEKVLDCQYLLEQWLPGELARLP
jgi:hypothetical protein